MNEDGADRDGLLEAERLELAAAFTAARHRTGVSLRGLAEATGLGLQTLVRIESGGAGVGLSNLQAALDAVGLRLKVARRR